ncbi:serine hydroxymethyltransferase [Plantactinospora sp. B5E13]|uniref:serine hydroxymethyltransferase n=1 Tax=unclassified Plantactinospora TaxID=2631981 RepID=UPI00325CA08A
MTLDGVRSNSASPGSLKDFQHLAFEELAQRDPELFTLLEQDLHRQSNTLMMVAASSVAPPPVLASAGTALGNITAEGYPGARYHAGCEVADEVERIAVRRARAAFGAHHANVQPHSGSSANLAVLFSLMRPGETMLALDLDAGGHLTHGAAASVTGRYFDAVHYGLDEHGRIDLPAVRELAERHRPRVIVCGASAYPRTLDFAAFRQIADAVGAWLVADVSHIAGLVVAGLHPSPIDHAHVTTTSTYKQLYGPRGGLILLGADHDTPVRPGGPTLAQALNRAIFPLSQGTPNLAAVAAKAHALGLVTTPQFRELAELIVADAAALADSMSAEGFAVLFGGTDNHMVLVDLVSHGLTGTVAESALESCGIVVNKNRIPGDTRPPTVASGMRLGTNTLAQRGMGPDQMPVLARLLDHILCHVKPTSDESYQLDPDVRAEVRRTVAELCRRYPLPGYPLAS